MAKLIHSFKRSYNLRMSPDGRLIVQTNASQINIFDSSTYEQKAQFTDIPNAKAVFSNDSNYLLAKSTDRKLGLYDLDELKLVHKQTLKKNHQTQDYGMVFSPDGKKVIDLVYTDSLLGYIAVWDVETWTQTRFYEGQDNVFRDISYSGASKRYFISGFHRGDSSSGHTIPFYLWFDTDTGSGVFTDMSLKNNERLVLVDELDSIISYPGVGKKNAEINVIPENRILLSLHDQIHRIALSDDSTRIAIMCEDRAVLYSFPTLKVLDELDTMNSFGDISFSPDGRKILIGTWKKGFIYEID